MSQSKYFIWVSHVLLRIPSLQLIVLDELASIGVVELVACKFVKLHVQNRCSSMPVLVIVGKVVRARTRTWTSSPCVPITF